MSEDRVPSEADEPPAPRPRQSWRRRIVTALALLLAVLTLGVVTLDSDIGHRFVVNRIGALRPANGLRYSIGRIDGSLFGRARLVDIRLRDPKGLVLYVPRAELNWTPLAWLHNRLDITSLIIPQARLFKLPQPTPTGRTGPILPGFDIHIGTLRVDRLSVAPAITGTPRRGRLLGHADIRGGRALVDLDAVVAGSDTLRLKLDAQPDRDRFGMDLHARGTAKGLLAKAIGFAQPIAADVHGAGRWSAWRGRAVADVGTTRLADLTLGNRSGAYTLAGTLTVAPLAHGKVQRLTAPRIAVNGAATLADRRLTGALDLHSAALAIHGEGALDLAASAFRDVRVRARLLQPAALFANMSGRAIELRMILDGAFATAAFEYRLTAERMVFGDTGFEEVRAAGKGHFSKAPVIVPIRLAAARVTGVGDVAGGILRNLSIEGILRVTSKLVTGDDLRLVSDKLNGRASLVVDLTNGHFEIGLNGGLSRYLIPGLGLVEVNSMLHVVPGPDGHGTRVIGKGSARVLRLDNGFFRSLAGGLPTIVTNLERTTDGVLHFTNLVLTGPQIRITGAGIRRRDGTFHFEGVGRQDSYGPLTLKLDGKIDKPTLDLVFQRPNDAMGLSNVVAHLDPVPAGFAFSAHGGSRLGPFDGAGMILLPQGGQAVISIAQLNVSNTHAHGDLAIVDGGFDGKLSVTGGGIGGDLLFRPQDTHQRIEAHLDATAARLAQAVSVRRGHLDLVALLDPAGTSIDATATASGIRRGALTIGRTAIHAALRGGTGEIRASIAGSRGRAFSIQSVIAVSPDRYSVSAQGTVDRKPLQLVTPAVFTHVEDGWRLAPTKLAFAGGAADVSGTFTGTGSAVDATLAKMPLSVLDIGYPGLGLGGEASGKLSFVQSNGAAPTGKINMTVRGLTRSGLVLSSRPVDVGIAGILEPGKAAARAVAASGGKTVGRAQMQLTLAPGADLAARIARAPLFAQLRYDGPADTLWRLTGIELFDLSGPVAIGADVGGTLDSPRIRGVVQANGAKIESATTGTVLTNVVASGRFGGSRLVLDKLTADAGKGGHVTGTGSFDLAAAHGFGIDLAVQAQNALLINRDDIAATVTGPLSFKSDGSGGTIAGKVTLTKSRYRLGQATAASAVPQLNIREINLPGGGEEDDAPPKPWKLAVHAHAADNLLVTGLGLRSEWSADLDIGGAPDNPAITGRADLVRGDYQFAGREFQLDRGKILFQGEVPANPALDIAANADSTGLSATIRVTGPALKPEISFTSNPALPEDELLSRLLFGTSITNLSAPEALQLASAVAALQNGKGGLDPINAVRRVAGLDRLRILPADPQTGAGTSVAAGKYVTRRLFAEIITDGQGYSATQVEFQVTRWLSVLSTISTLGRQSGNVRVSKDY
ncbi:translocation/assembly module TamB [Sphingomonas sp. GC_Shp_3]|uniref:translocation/assembly module TamB domain-containing protein n=1 Tax=Sphingomonas sp. GC_Shp_3 TaxID=2937383 RepID=UPI002269DC03|nr:translocation/assembly module TamB [Sphingomonas sp. GC_Shp_3]